jgi:hypothetical protein
MATTHSLFAAIAGGAFALLFASGTAAAVEQFSREQDIGVLRLGQRVQVDDGVCPQGQIKEVSGSQLTAAGVVRVVRCVPRQGAKR